MGGDGNNLIRGGGNMAEGCNIGIAVKIWCLRVIEVTRHKYLQLNILFILVSPE